MQCEKFETLWNEALDERRIPAEDSLLAAHAAQCRHCAEMLSLTDTLFAGLEARPTAVLSPDFAERVLADFNRPAPRLTKSAMVFAVLALAAAVAVVVGLRFQIPAGQNPAIDGLGGGTEVAIEQQKKAERAFEHDPRDRVPMPLAPALESLPGLNDEYLAMIRQTGTAFALFPDQVRRAALSDEPGLVSDHIRPVAQPMTAAWNALRRTLPGSATEMPSMTDDAKSSAYPMQLETIQG